MIMKFLLFTVAAIVLTEFAAGEKALVPQTSKLCRDYGRDGVYRFFNETRTCFQVGRRGPCGDSMIFYADPINPDYGQCDCDISKRCKRHMLYWPPTNQCYFMYEQGPCPPQQWLVFGRNLQPTCERDVCSVSQTEFDEDLGPDNFWILHRRECVLTGSEGHCPLPNEKLIFNGFSLHVNPFCSAITYECKIPEVPSLVCAPGQKWHSHDGCNLWNPGSIHHSPHIHGHHRGHHHHGHRWNHNHSGGNNIPLSYTTTPAPASRHPWTPQPTFPTTTTGRVPFPDNRRPDPLLNPVQGNNLGARRQS